MATLNGVFEALGKMYNRLGNIEKGALGATTIYGASAGNMLRSIGNAAFTRTTWKEAAERGSVLPYKLKKGLGATAFLGMSAVGLTQGVVGAESVHTNEVLSNDSTPYSSVPGTISRFNSPYKKPEQPIDDMGATGDIVLALNKNR